MNKFKHQGDVLFVPYHEELPEDEVTHNNCFKLALGEHTGHSHRIPTKNKKDMRIFKNENGEYILELKDSAWVEHEEHGTITIEPGRYIVPTEREYDWFQMTQRQVID